MFSCIYCGVFFEKAECFLSHVKYVHINRKTLKCSFDNCFRSYGSFQSFSSHVLSKHIDAPIRNYVIDNYVQSDTIEQDEVLPDDIENRLNEDEDYQFSDSESSDDDSELFDENFNLNKTCDSESDYSEYFDIFMAKLYAHDISKNLLHIIAKDTAVLVNNILNSKQFRSKENFSLDIGNDKNAKNVHEKKIYVKPNSDFYYLKKFEKMGTMIMPESYLIGERKEYRFL